MGVELITAPSTAGVFMAGSPSIQRATRVASVASTPRPRVASAAALVMAPVLLLTSIFTMVVPFEVHTLRFFQKFASVAALKATVLALHDTTGDPELVS